MLYSDTYIKKLITEYSTCRSDLKNELKSLPEGTLVRRGNRYNWDHLENGKRKRTGITKDHDMQRALARRKYIETALYMIENNIRHLKRMTEAPLPDNILSMMRNAYTDLPAEYFLGANCESSDDPDEWMNTAYPQNPYRTEEKTHITGFGLHVRSKSECIIAEELKRRSIRFRYDAPVNINTKLYYPDFTIMGPDGSLIYWEHCGLVSDPGYMFKHKRKLEQYEEYGIVPWRNLVITYDDESGNIDVRKICAAIDVWITSPF